MDQQLLQRSVGRYQQIARMQTEIEQALQARNNDRMIALANDMTVLQEEAKTDDAAILDCLRRQPDVHAHEAIRSLLTLMADVKMRNQRLTSQLQGIMAVQRNELLKLKQGNTVLQGYRPVSDQTGKRIFVSN